MTKPKKIFAVAVVVIILAAAVTGWCAFHLEINGCGSLRSNADAPVVAYFSEALQNGFIEKKGGRPIEGFEPFMFMEVYPGLGASDFNCVKADGGFYTTESGQVVFNLYKSIRNRRSSAERSIAPDGMNQLLQNVTTHHHRPFPRTNAEVDYLINVIVVYLNNTEKQDIKSPGSGDPQEVKATQALRFLVDSANNADKLISVHGGPRPIPQFNFEIVSSDGKFSNFGILRYVDDVRADSVIEEHAVIFKEGGIGENNLAEVDRDTNKVVSMHRKIQYSDYQSTKEELEIIVRQFLKETGNDPDKLVSEFGSAIEFSSNNKEDDNDFKWGNYFFRWEEKGFALPKGLEMELTPFLQVGITSGGFIFSYDNTIQLYRNLPREALRAICAFVEMPQSDDTLIDRDKGIVKVYFSEYKPFRNRYLVLPYEPKNNFEGCSESAKTFLRNIPKGRN